MAQKIKLKINPSSLISFQSRAVLRLIKLHAFNASNLKHQIIILLDFVRYSILIIWGLTLPCSKKIASNSNCKNIFLNTIKMNIKNNNCCCKKVLFKNFAKTFLHCSCFLVRTLTIETASPKGLLTLIISKTGS